MNEVIVIIYILSGKNMRKKDTMSPWATMETINPLLTPNGYIFDAIKQDIIVTGIATIFPIVLFKSLENPALTSS